MRRRSGGVVWLVGLLGVLWCFGGQVAAVGAAGTGPSEPCVPGTVWEDLSSGTKYMCVYDEMYGGPRWVLLGGGQAGKQAFLAKSSTLGCTLGTVGINRLNGSGADAFVRSYRWPCATTDDRAYQPAGELRARVQVQRYNGGWSTCRDSGFSYSSVTAWSWTVGLDMGGVADCGAGSYRAWGFADVFQGGAWRGSTLISPGLVLP